MEPISHQRGALYQRRQKRANQGDTNEKMKDRTIMRKKPGCKAAVAVVAGLTAGYLFNQYCQKKDFLSVRP